MATELTRDEMRRLARLGAERRLEDLRQEEAAIRAAFPELGAAPTAKRRGRRPGRPAASAAVAPETAASADPIRRRKRRKMSAAEKKAVSDRMRKYWASRRKAKG